MELSPDERRLFAATLDDMRAGRWDRAVAGLETLAARESGEAAMAGRVCGSAGVPPPASASRRGRTPHRRAWRYLVALMAALATLFLGTLLGSAVAVERWRAHPVLLPRPLSTQETRVSPPPGGTGVLGRVAGMTDRRDRAG